MNILVTGTAGFIGFHLTKALLLRGYKVVGLDNLNSYYDVHLKYGRLNELKTLHKDFSFIQCDITNLPQLTGIFKETHFDKVCNLAAQAGVRYSFENPHTYIQSNIVGFMNILELCTSYGISHLVYASSSSVYGNNAKIPFEETDRTDDPQSIYAATKKADELLAHVYSSQLNLPTTGLRFFTVYGPWGRPDMAPFLFMKSILEGKTIKIFNNGQLRRDFSYIDDIVAGILKIVETVPVLHSGSHDKSPIYNIGNSSPVELMDFINTLEEVIGKKAIKEFVGMQPGDVYTTYANTAAIESDYGFKPNTPLFYGITQFYNWYRSYWK
ncbi:MAG: SDR family NAD(P)-dependent oxidoreductase [Bacteroidales bacterium]